GADLRAVIGQCLEGLVAADQRVADRDQLRAHRHGAYSVLDAERSDADRYLHRLLGLLEPLDRVARGVGPALVGAVVQVDHVDAPRFALLRARGDILAADEIDDHPDPRLLRGRHARLNRLVGRV